MSEYTECPSCGNHLLVGDLLDCPFCGALFCIFCAKYDEVYGDFICKACTPLEMDEDFQ